MNKNHDSRQPNIYESAGHQQALLTCPKRHDSGILFGPSAQCWDSKVGSISALVLATCELFVRIVYEALAAAFHLTTMSADIARLDISIIRSV